MFCYENAVGSKWFKYFVGTSQTMIIFLPYSLGLLAIHIWNGDLPENSEVNSNIQTNFVIFDKFFSEHGPKIFSSHQFGKYS